MLEFSLRQAALVDVAEFFELEGWDEIELSPDPNYDLLLIHNKRRPTFIKSFVGVYIYIHQSDQTPTYHALRKIALTLSPSAYICIYTRYENGEYNITPMRANHYMTRQEVNARLGKPISDGGD